MRNPLEALSSRARIARAGHEAAEINEAAKRALRHNGKVPLAMVTGVSAGMALMYIFDPQQGRRRRAITRDKVASATLHLRRGAEAAWKDMRQRGYGIYAEGRRRFQKGEVPDDTLHARVRAKLGRYTRYSHAVQVAVREGAVTLSGPALRQDAERLISQIARLRGVRSIENRLALYDDPSHVSALQGVYDVRAGRRAWSPSQRLAAGAVGTSLLIGGLAKRGAIGWSLGALGAGLFAAGMLKGMLNSRR